MRAGSSLTLALPLLLVVLLAVARPALAIDPSPGPEHLMEEEGAPWWEMFAKLWEFLSSGFGFLSNVVRGVADFFNLMARGVDFARRVIGSPGDPGLYLAVQSKLALHACCSADTRARETAAEALGNCSRYRLRDLAWLLSPELARDGRSLCEIAPSGFLGMVSLLFFGVGAAASFVAWFFQNFLLVHGLAFGGTLMWAASTSFTRRSLQPLERWVEWWGRYIMLYVRFFKWVLEKLHALAQIIAELLPL